MRRINLTLDRQGEANLRVLKMHGYSNVSELVRQLISNKVENIKQGLDEGDVLSVNPRARLIDGDTILLQNCTVRANFVPLLRLLKADVITRQGDDLYCKLQDPHVKKKLWE